MCSLIKDCIVKIAVAVFSVVFSIALKILGCFFSPRETLEFCLNFTVGIGVFLFIGLFAKNEYGQTLINTKFDEYIGTRMECLTAWKEKPASWNDIVFFDIDEKSVASLGHPYFFPRGYLAALIEYAKNCGAKLILVDMDLSVGDKPLYERSKKTEPFWEELNKVSDLSGDKMLVSVLQNIEMETNAKTDTKVLIPKTSFIDRTARNSFLQAILAKKFPDKKSGGSFEYEHILWGSPHFYISDADPYTRFWTPYIEVHNEEKEQDEILWTLPFMAAALYSDENAEEKLQLLEQKLKNNSEDSNQPKKSEICSPISFPWWRKEQSELFLAVEHSEDEKSKNLERELAVLKHQMNRIGFEFISDHSPSLGTSKKIFELKDRDKLVHRQIYHWRRKDLLQKKQEADSARQEEEKYIPIPWPLSTDKTEPIGYLCRTDVGTGATERAEDGIPFVNCDGKIVIIGRSDDDGNDLFWTPVEQMPGMYVHGNIIATLRGDNLPHLAEPICFLVSNAISLIGFSFITVKVTPWKSFIYTYLFSWLLSLGFFVIFFKCNIFVCAGAASFAVTLFDAVNKPVVDWFAKRVDLT